MRAAVVAVLACLQVAMASPVAVSQSATVYPSGSSVPENLLRIEVRFARPLRTPLEVSQIKLLDALGDKIEDAFLDLILPSADGKWVTLLMHPGRVKSGVGPNVALGRALQNGSTVRFVLDHPALAYPLIKVWTVTAFDAQPPQPENWSFKVPRLQSRDALIVHLGQPISSSAETLIAVRGPKGHRVAGRISLDRCETIWRFTPSRPWQTGRYAVVTRPDLEDPAGNRACGAFELVHASEVRCDSGSNLPFEVLRGISARGTRGGGRSGTKATVPRMYPTDIR